MTNRMCWVGSCREPYDKWGMCTAHEKQWLLEHPRIKTRYHGTNDDRFQKYVEVGHGGWGATREGCWHWLSSLSDHGYGLFGKSQGDGKSALVRAHRYSYELYTGPIPEGMDLDHLCRVRPCVNPEHLEAVLPATNILRGTGPSAVHAVKTHCPQKHLYSPENTKISTSGARICRKCVTTHSLARATGTGKGQYQKERTHCPKGHEYTEANTIIEKAKKSDGSIQEKRRCRDCRALKRGVGRKMT